MGGSHNRWKCAMKNELRDEPIVKPHFEYKIYYYLRSNFNQSADRRNTRKHVGYVKGNQETITFLDDC